MEYEYKIKDREGYNGHIKLKIPNGIEKLDIAKKCVYFINEAGELKERNQYEAARLLIEELKERVTQVSVKSEEYTFESFDDLSYDDVGFQILSELGQKLVGGFRLGKSSKKK